MLSYSPIPELNALWEFQDRVGYEEYADGFGLTRYGDTSGLEAGWSKDPEFLARLIPFAQATGGGSLYAFWRADDRADVGSLPVVVFGDEGGQHVVARNFAELVTLLGFDAEPMVDWDDAYYYRSPEDVEHRDAHDEFVAWMGETLGVAPAADPDAVTAAARAEFGERFAAFVDDFVPS